MDLNAKVFSITSLSAIMLASAVQLFDAYYFLPKTVLHINDLPKSAKIIKINGVDAIDLE